MLLQRAVMGLALIIMSVAATTAYGHKVNVFAYVEGDQVYMQGYFSDGTAAKNSAVTVYGGDGRELVKGLTNEEGAFTFAVPDKQAARIVLNAGQGHQAAYEISAEELAGAVAPAGSSSSSHEARPAQQTQTADNDDARISEALVRRAVAQGLMPLAREIAELKERRGFSDIVGGIGFIVGILGVFAYVKARQEVRKIKK